MPPRRNRRRRRRHIRALRDTAIARARDIAIAHIPGGATAQRLAQDLDLAVGLIGDVFNPPPTREQAARTIQRNFRWGWEWRRAARARGNGRQRMQVDPVSNLLQATMPRARGRKSKRGRKRKRRVSFRRRRRSIYRRRRRVKRTHHLRLLPGGFPQSKKVKLRVLKQCAIGTPDTTTGWGYIIFRPADPYNPFLSFDATEGAGGVHRNLLFTLKNGTSITPKPQPFGWDDWAAIYPNYVVLGSKITINFVQGSNSATNTTQFVAGWNKNNYHDGAVGHDQSFTQKYVDTIHSEVSDMLNIKVIQNPKILTQIGTGSTMEGGSRSFTTFYSLKKQQRRLKKMKLHTPEHDGASASITGSPLYSPQAFFIIGDLAGDTAQIKLNCFVTIDYTIQFSKHAIDDGSVV